MSVAVLDDKLEELEEANPFSFKEFLKTKNLSLSKEDTANSRLYAKVNVRSTEFAGTSDRPSPRPTPSVSLLTRDLLLEEVLQAGGLGKARQLLVLVGKSCVLSCGLSCLSSAPVDEIGSSRSNVEHPGKRACGGFWVSALPPAVSFRKPRGTHWGSTATPQSAKPWGLAWNTSSRFLKTQRGLGTSWMRPRTRTTVGTGPTCRLLWSRATRPGWLPARHPVARTSPSSPAHRSWWGPSLCLRGR